MRLCRLHVALEAVVVGLLGQVTDAVLEGVVHPLLLEADLGVPVALDEGLVAAGLVLHPLHGGGVLAEEDAPARHVVGEAVDGLQAARDRARLEQRDRITGHASLLEETGEGHAGDAGAEDRDLQMRGAADAERGSVGGRIPLPSPD